MGVLLLESPECKRNHFLQENLENLEQMSDIVHDLEQSYSSTCAEITQLSGKLKQTTDSQEISEINKKIDVLFTDARETLEQIELETHGLQGRNKEKIVVRLDSYRAELKRLQQNFKACHTEAKERTDRLELFTKSEDCAPDVFLDSSSRQLEDGRRLLAETEQIGGSVLEDLSSQRETLQRARGRLKDVETGLGSSNTILKGIIFKARQNKLVLLAFIVIIVLLLLWGLYRLVF